jgi:hypothetical protein
MAKVERALRTLYSDLAARVDSQPTPGGPDTVMTRARETMDADHTSQVLSVPGLPLE